MFCTVKVLKFFYYNRAQPDIMSGPEVRQIFKIRTVRKPDVFLPGHRTFKNRKKVQTLVRLQPIGLNRTSRPVRKSGKLSKSGLSGNRTFSFPDAGLLKIRKEKNSNFLFQTFFSNFFQVFFSYFFCLFIW